MILDTPTIILGVVTGILLGIVIIINRSNEYRERLNRRIIQELDDMLGYSKPPGDE